MKNLLVLCSLVSVSMGISFGGDANKCASSPCSSHGTCTNADGSFTCECNTGYVGDGFSCRDVNECTEVSGFCGNGASCTNTPGGASCSCPAGTTGNPNVECVEITCPQPTPPENGKILFGKSSYKPGDSLIFRCNDLYFHDSAKHGFPRYTCGNNGEWRGSKFICEEITCPQLTPPENGKIISDKSSYKPGGSLIFRCNDHYFHDSAKHGFPMYTCGNNGEWSGRRLVCEGTCRFACSAWPIVKGSPPCGCESSCKKNGTCCADYNLYLLNCLMRF